MAQVVGTSTGNTIAGVIGDNVGFTANGVWGKSSSGWSAVYGSNSSNAAAVHGAHTHPSLPGYGVYGSSSGPGGYGLYGTGSYGVYADGSSRGVWATSGAGGVAVYAESSGTAVYGVSTSSYGLRGGSGSGTVGIAGVFGLGRDGVIGEAQSGYTGAGVVGRGGAPSYGGSYAGYFIGPVHVTGYLTKAGGGFLIDHPLAPADKLLEHSFVESPDRKNVYDGIGTADSVGELTVKLPAYFEALNKDVRYQLTAIGKPAPGLHVKREVSNNEFVVAGAEPGQRVCWQLTGIRKDVSAEANPVVVERDKPADERGFYLHPEAHGQPSEKGIGMKRHGGTPQETLPGSALPEPPPPPPDQP